ncbi:MAG: hypothetical protein H7210_07500 [Pyrinomonadaceae bacterium]|nr:hypothetical protein [Phycisphaerales bacterium]
MKSYVAACAVALGAAFTLLGSFGSGSVATASAQATPAVAGDEQPDPPHPPVTSPAAPRATRRIVQNFDFEEPDNPYPVPRHWNRAQDGPAYPRPGFPRYNEAAFDHSVARSGTSSVRLPTRGGSTGLRLVPGALPVFPQGDYAISAVIRTKNLRSARAYLTARFLDQDQRPIPGQEVRSLPIASEGAWTPVTVELMGFHDAVAFLQIELEVLQPRQQPGNEQPVAPLLDAHRIERDDLDGAAWFDDVGIFQLPRVELATTALGNIFRRPQQPTVRFVIRDMVGEQLYAHLRVTDIDGVTVDESTLPVNASGRPTDWAPALTKLGWYRVDMDVRGETSSLASSQTSLIWLAPIPHQSSASSDRASLPSVAGTATEQALSSERARFGILADRAEPWQGQSIINIVRQLGTGHITLPIWGDQITIATLEAGMQAMSPTLDEMLRMNQQVRLCLPNLPAEIALKHGMDASDPLSLGLVDQKDWLPFLNPVLDRYGQRITRWQIGRVAAPDSLPGEGGDEPFWGQSLAAAVPKLRESLALLVPGPIVAIPWRSDLSMDALQGSAAGRAGGSPDTVVMVVPYWTDHDAVMQLRQRWSRPLSSGESGAGSPELILIPQASPAESFGERASVAGFARQTIELWRVFADPARTTGDTGAPSTTGTLTTLLAINLPWQTHGSRRQHIAPNPELAAWSTLADRLQGRRIIGEYPAPPGIRCYILSPTTEDTSVEPESGALSPLEPAGAGAADTLLGKGALIAWNESGDPDQAFVNVYASAANIKLIDPFGNEEAADRYAKSVGTLSIPVTATPLFIEGIDDKLARLIASFKLEPAFAPAMAAEHEHSLLLTNPWRSTLQGQLQIVPPTRQTVDPASGAPGSPAPVARNRRTWTVAPDGIIEVSILGGQTQNIPFALTIPAWEEAGNKEITILLKLDNSISQTPIKLYGHLHVGLSNLELVPRVDLAPDVTGPDVVVTAAIRNDGSRERLLRMQATAPGFPTREIIITNPEPGEVIYKKFVFKDAANKLRGKRIRISIGDTEAPQRLNTSVVVP